jgi:hypothetical protein
MAGTGDEGRRPRPIQPSEEADDDGAAGAAGSGSGGSPRRLSPGRLQAGSPTAQLGVPRPQLPEKLAPMGQGRVPQLAQAFDVGPGEEAAPPLSVEASGSSSAVGTDANVPAYTVVRALRVGDVGSGSGSGGTASSPRSPIGAPWRVPAPLLTPGSGTPSGQRSSTSGRGAAEGGLTPRSPRAAGSGATASPRSPAAQAASPRSPIFAPQTMTRGSTATRASRGGLPAYAFGSRIPARPASGGAAKANQSGGGSGDAGSPVPGRSTGGGSSGKRT